MFKDESEFKIPKYLKINFKVTYLDFECFTETN